MWRAFRDAASAWSRHNAPRLGAALAYYSVLSITPALVVALAISGWLFGPEAVRGEIYWQMQGVVGGKIADIIQGLLKSAYHPVPGVLAGVLGFAAMLGGASGVFLELRDTLNYIWDLPARKEQGIWQLLRERFLSFAMVLGAGILLAASVAIAAAVQATAAWSGANLGLPTVPQPLLITSNILISLAVTSLLFALIYRIIPEVQVDWCDAIVGAVLTAPLFSAGRFLIGVYLGKASVGSAYGAAGSIVVLLVWVYYSAQIFLYGAEFTHAWAQRRRARVRDRPNTGLPSAAQPKTWSG